MRKNKKAQLSIFIIAALIIVVIIALLFVIIKKPGTTIIPSEDPQGYIQKCARDSLEKIENSLIQNNLYIGLDKNFMIYYGKRVPYLCQTSQFYIACVNQEPMLIEKVRKDIQNNVKTDIEKCFSDLIKDLNSKANSVQTGDLDFSIKFKDKSILANIDKQLTITHSDITKEYDNFDIEISSPIFNLMKTAMRIVDYESTYCEFNDMNWMMNYPSIGIKVFVTSDKTKVYTLTDKATGKTISFAVKSCALPAGI